MKRSFSVENPWFAGTSEITTFALDDLLGTKLRALFQRRKGRDLFDLWLALDRGGVDAASLLSCFHRYMSDGGHVITRAIFEENLHEKAGRIDFRGGMDALLRPGVFWDFDAALRLVLPELVSKLPGDAWRGDGS